MVNSKKILKSIVAPSLSVVGLASICKISYTNLWIIFIFSAAYNYLISVLLGIESND
jgi:hypothetical protein